MSLLFCFFVFFIFLFDHYLIMWRNLHNFPHIDVGEKGTVQMWDH